MLYRNPETSKRPSFPDIVQRFSLPDTKLLKWSEEDKATNPEAATLGADLDTGQKLYKDLQERYQNVPKKESTKNNDIASSNATNQGSTMPTTPTAKTPPKRQSTSSATVVTPTRLQANVLATSAAGAHSYEDPSFLTFFQEDINQLNSDLAKKSDAEKGVITVSVAGGHSYEDPNLVEALAEGKTVTDALSTNV